MAEIRLHPFTGERIIVNEKRLQRPTVLQEIEDAEKECPFCPTSTKRHPGLPQNYGTLSFINLFSALTEDPETVKLDKTSIYQKMEAFGVCEVILYSDNHDMMFYDQPIEKIMNIIKLWQEREHILGIKQQIKYVYTFENRGAGVGVTIHHPHGQIYALHFIPPYISQKLNSSESYYNQQSSCLHCRVILQEKTDEIRIVYENEHFIAFAPFYSRLLYEIHIYPKRHLQYLSELNIAEVKDLALIIKEVRRKYDRLFIHPANFMMMFYPAPSDGKNYPFHHFHIEFLCLDRDSTKLKYRAGVETGLQLWTNDIAPETAASLMKAL